MLAPLAGVAPKLVRELYDLCGKEQYPAARKPQEELAALRQTLKAAGVAGLKAAMLAMGRDCGAPRAPLEEAVSGEYEKLATQLGAMAALRTEKRSW